MKNILAIETATSICSISLFLEGCFVEAKTSAKPRSHAVKLPVFTDELLKKYNCNVSDLDGIAISSGPGSYTGLRIGISLAKGLALSSEVPLLPVKTLVAMDTNIIGESTHWVCIHSHRNMVFAQKFKEHESISEPLCISFEDLDSSPIFGFGLQKINDDIDFTEIVPTSINVGMYAFKNVTDLIERNMEKVSPLYLTEFNISNLR